MPAIDWTRGTIGGIVLRPQTFAVLNLLQGKANQLVTKDELMAAVWPNIAVTDDSLVQCIAEIRKALCDDEHTIIKTVPKRGYVFEPTSGAKAPNSRRLVIYATAAIAAAMLVIAAAWLYNPSPSTGVKPSIAVLPFKNLGADARWSRFAEGITENIITDLSHAPEAMVIARTSTEIYRDKPADVRSIGSDLGVSYVLEGSLQPAGDRIRVTAQLIDAESGSHVWSERYDRPTTDFFAVESEITAKIAGTLSLYQGVVASSQLKRAQRKRPGDLSAYDLYLLGLAAKHTVSPQGLAEAEVLFKKALAIDPGLARAHIGLNYVYGFMIDMGLAHSPAATAALMVSEAQQAMALDPNDAESHLAQGIGYVYSGELAKAKPFFERAVDMAPGNADVLAISAWYWLQLGEPQRGAEVTDLAIRLNPRYPYWYNSACRAGYFFAGRFADALSCARRINLAVAPDHAFIAAGEAQLGRMDDAKRAAAETLHLDPRWSAEGYLSDIGGFLREQDAELFMDGAAKAGLSACMSKEDVAKRPGQWTLGRCDAGRGGA